MHWRCKQGMGRGGQKARKNEKEMPLPHIPTLPAVDLGGLGSLIEPPKSTKNKTF